MMSDSPSSLLIQLRATARHAELLDAGAQIPDLHLWRAHAGLLVDALRQDLLDAGCPAMEVDEASLAQCVLLDELTLRALPEPKRNEWLRESLQMRFHRVSDGAVRVWDRIDGLLGGGCQDRRLLELYGLVLALGFDGGRGNADACLQRVKLVLNRLDAGNPASAWPVPTAPAGAAKGAVTSSRAELLRLIAGVVMVTAVAIGTLWIAFDASLRSAIGRLPEAAAAPIDVAPHEEAR